VAGLLTGQEQDFRLLYLHLSEYSRIKDKRAKGRCWNSRMLGSLKTVAKSWSSAVEISGNISPFQANTFGLVEDVEKEDVGLKSTNSRYCTSQRRRLTRGERFAELATTDSVRYSQ
jgi:hypothetical protein